MLLQGTSTALASRNVEVAAADVSSKYWSAVEYAERGIVRVKFEVSHGGAYEEYYLLGFDVM
jgi:hypothetical protein